MHALRTAPGARAQARTTRQTRVEVKAAGFDRDYWLGHCEGYRVDASDGRLGFVEELRFCGDSGSAATLVVRAGRLGKRLLLIPAGEVAFIVPRAERIWLNSPVKVVATETRPAVGLP
jgi:hypothetical protein